MRVQVELASTQDIAGLKDIVEQWESQFPMGKLAGVSAYGTFRIQLEMPEATKVLVPQIVDARSSVEPLPDATDL